MQITPYQNDSVSKKEQVATMFNHIAYRYDFLNHFLSLGIDILWRKRAIRILRKEQPKTILDIATGTGDFALEAIKLNPHKITGIDISNKMLEKGREKIINKKFADRIELLEADSESIPFSDNSFDAITVGFGVRNFEHLDIGLKEMLRVLKTNGMAVVLEFSKPQRFPYKQIFSFYFTKILPLIGKIVSKDSVAYSYLPASVKAFPEGESFLKELKNAGFNQLYKVPLTFGIATLYIGKK